MAELEVGIVLHVKTMGSAYIVQKREDGWWVWGNTKVPVPTPLYQVLARGFPVEDLIIESAKIVDTVI
jgi:hypothetical protein